MTPSTRLKMMGLWMPLPIKDPNPLVPSTGATRKSPNPSTSAKMRVPAISFLESSSSSPRAMFVDAVSAFMPSHNVSPRESAPNDGQTEQLAAARNRTEPLRTQVHISRGRADGHPPEVGRAHQHALHDGLSADPHGLWPYCLFWLAWRRFWNRCTRPPVSTMRCLPV